MCLQLVPGTLERSDTNTGYVCMERITWEEHINQYLNPGGHIVQLAVFPLLYVPFSQSTGDSAGF